MKRIALITPLLSVLLLSLPAEASQCAESCSSYSDISVDVSPALSCLVVEWVQDSCYCRVSLKLQNQCSDAILVGGQGWTCTTSGAKDSCEAIAAGATRSYFPNPTVSPLSLSIQSSQGKHQISVQFTEDPPKDVGVKDGCSMFPGGGGSPLVAGGELLLGAALLLRSRRRASSLAQGARLA